MGRRAKTKRGNKPGKTGHHRTMVKLAGLRKIAKEMGAKFVGGNAIDDKIRDGNTPGMRKEFIRHADQKEVSEG